MTKGRLEIQPFPAGAIVPTNEALDKGVVDATNWSTASQNDRLGYHKIALYFTYPDFHSMPVVLGKPRVFP